MIISSENSEVLVGLFDGLVLKNMVSKVRFFHRNMHIWPLLATFRGPLMAMSKVMTSCFKAMLKSHLSPQGDSGERGEPGARGDRVRHTCAHANNMEWH